MMSMCRDRSVPSLGGYNKMHQAGLRRLVYGSGVEPAPVAYIDGLPQTPARVDEAIGRIVTPVRPGWRVDDRDAGPIVVG